MRVIDSGRTLADPQSLRVELQSLYDLGRDTAIRFWRRGPAGGDVYFLENASSRYCVKIYFTQCSAQQIETTTAIMDYLNQTGLPVPAIIPNCQGKLVSGLQYPEGQRCAVMFDHVTGSCPDLNNPDQLRHLGQTMGEIYQALDRYSGPTPPRSLDYDYLIGDALRLIRHYRPQDTEKIDYLQSIGDDLWSQLQHASTSPQFGLCHGDLHTGNMVCQPDNTIVLFDFDACGMGWRVFDMGVFANTNWTNSSSSALATDQHIFETFLEGYTQVLPVTDHQRRVFPYVLGIRHLELFGVVLRHCVALQGENWIEGCLEFHVNWFKAWSESRS